MNARRSLLVADINQLVGTFLLAAEQQPARTAQIAEHKSQLIAEYFTQIRVDERIERRATTTENQNTNTIFLTYIKQNKYILNTCYTSYMRPLERNG